MGDLPEFAQQQYTDQSDKDTQYILQSTFLESDIYANAVVITK